MQGQSVWSAQALPDPECTSSARLRHVRHVPSFHASAASRRLRVRNHASVLHIDANALGFPERRTQAEADFKNAQDLPRWTLAVPRAILSCARSCSYPRCILILSGEFQAGEIGDNVLSRCLTIWFWRHSLLFEIAFMPHSTSLSFSVLLRLTHSVSLTDLVVTGPGLTSYARTRQGSDLSRLCRR
jgi:hypothetical protein